MSPHLRIKASSVKLGNKDGDHKAEETIIVEK